MGHVDEFPAPRYDPPLPPGFGGSLDSPSSTQNSDLMPSGIGYDTTRDEGIFIIPGTAPLGLRMVRPRSVTPLLPAFFAPCSVAIDRWILPVTHVYGRVLRGFTHIPPGTFGRQNSVAVRPLLLLLAFLLALLSAGSVRRRLRLLLTTALTFALLVMASDLALMRVALLGGPGPFGALGNTIAGLDGIIALTIGVFTSAALPPGVVVRSERRRARRDVALLCGAVTTAAVATWLTKRQWGEILRVISQEPFLGGIASALVIFFGLFPGLLFAVKKIHRCTRRGRHTLLFPWASSSQRETKPASSVIVSAPQ